MWTFNKCSTCPGLKKEVLWQDTDRCWKCGAIKDKAEALKCRQTEDAIVGISTNIFKKLEVIIILV